jgi:hypothetical protein
MGEWVDVNVVVPDVDGWLRTLNEYAENAIDRASSVASSLNYFSPGQYNPNVSFKSIGTDIGLDLSNKPTRPNLVVPTRTPPGGIGISTPSISVDAAPEFTDFDPSINLPDVPPPLSLSVPIKEFELDLTSDFPISPDYILPEVPTLLSLNLPSMSDISLPIFSLDFPTSNSLIVPGVTFTFSEALYSSPLLDKVKSELARRLGGGTGLNPIVEQAIWDRGRDRESKAVTIAERNLIATRAAQGFSRPTGAALAALEGVVQDYQGKIIELSREIMVKQAELEQANLTSSIQQTIALEDILIKESLNINQRSFEVAKYIQDVAVDLFKAQVAVYTTEVEAYKAYSEAYKAKVQAELSKVEIFKAEIDAQKLRGEINEQNIRIYVATFEGIKAQVDIYKAAISAVSERLKAEGLKIEAYKGDVEAYATTVRAKSEEYGMYSEQIKGELAKVSIYDSKVKAYASRIQAYASKADVSIKQAEVLTDIEGLKIKKYEADVDAFIKQVQADQLFYQAAADVYRTEASVYGAENSLNRSVAELELKQADNTIQQNKYTSDIAIANAQISLESVKAAYQALLESKKAAGSIYAQIGSSALSAINVSASLSGNAGISLAEAHNYQNQ